MRKNNSIVERKVVIIDGDGRYHRYSVRDAFQKIESLVKASRPDVIDLEALDVLREALR